MIVYRICVEVGYNTVDLEFQNIEEAGEFAKSFLTHAKVDKGNRKPKISLDVIDLDEEFEYSDTDSVKEEENE